MTPFFATRGLRRSFGGVVAVDDVSIEIEQGRINGLIGPNGSGKTTFFNLVTGLIKPDAGEVVFLGRSIDQLRPHRIVRRGLGRTFQSTRVFPRMTVLENMLVAVRRTGTTQLLRNAIRGSEADRAMEWLRRVRLERYRDVEARALSFGQQKLLEFTALLMVDPDLILLDEPAGGINPVMMEQMAQFIRDLRTEGRTFLIVEHNMDLVMNLCEHIIVFDRGAVLAEGSPAEIRGDQRVLEAYLGV